MKLRKGLQQQEGEASERNRGGQGHTGVYGPETQNDHKRDMKCFMLKFIEFVGVRGLATGKCWAPSQRKQ